jgi:nicotinamide-nucleotide amidase
MQAVLISIGDELLIGQTINTNASWMCRFLNENGVDIVQIITIKDNEKAIVDALDKAQQLAPIILITGGLGPTKDDITKLTLAKYFKSKLIRSPAAYENVKTIFERFNRPLLEINERQADVPEDCIVVINPNGTAPGMIFEKEKTAIAAMPGVPHEMRYIMKEGVIPLIKRKFKANPILHETLLTSGLGESFLAEKIKHIEESLPEDISIAYLPSTGCVKIRLSTYISHNSDASTTLKKWLDKIAVEAGSALVSKKDELLVQFIQETMISKKFTLALAESCTGGALSSIITSISGCSSYFKGGLIAYDNSVKIEQLKVKLATIEKHGAVSSEVATKMAESIRKKLKSTHSIAITGTAGPTGGTDLKPIGTVFISVSDENQIITKKFQFGKTRELNIERTTIVALDMLRRFVAGTLKED